MSEPWRLYAFEYARRMARADELFYADRSGATQPMSYYFWALERDDQVILVDTGCERERAEKRGLDYLMDPRAALERAGLVAEAVSDIVLTHLHWDHAGAVQLFPQARLHIQADELEFWRERRPEEKLLLGGFNRTDLAYLETALADGRVVVCNGVAEVADGVEAVSVGGHTPGSQVVAFLSRWGRAVLASDAAYLYANVDRQHPQFWSNDLAGAYRALRLLRELADRDDLIIPGHDPLVMERLGAHCAHVAVL